MWICFPHTERVKNVDKREHDISIAKGRQRESKWIGLRVLVQKLKEEEHGRFIQSTRS